MLAALRTCLLLAIATSAAFIGTTLLPGPAQYALCCLAGTGGFLGSFALGGRRHSTRFRLPRFVAVVGVLLASTVGSALAMTGFFFLLHPRPEAVFQANILGAAGALVTVMGAWVALVAARVRDREQVKRFFAEGVLEPDALVLIDGRFQIDQLVEQGGMGVVYRALDRTTRDWVALKLMLKRGDEQLKLDRFARETRILASLDHPRIAGYVAHGRAASGQAYLAMKWLDGEDLRAALRRGPLSLADSLRVLAGAAEGLAAVHGQGIIHRDLKPGNLYLRGRSAADLLLLDFGLARDVDSESHLTQATAIIGTPHYMAPEQASSGAQVVPATDVFALGCIFYECLTGRHAFGGAQVVGVLARILFDTPEPVREIRPAVPEAWAELLRRMLSKDAALRPASGAALLEEVRRLPEAGPETQPAAPSPAATADQVLVSVVLATAPGWSAGQGLFESPSGFESLRSAMNRFNCPLERLLDGSVLATIFPPHSATDQARIAARCALSLRELWPNARIAVTTGRGPLSRSVPVGDAADRAAQIVESRTRWDGVRLDALTAGLLDNRFNTVIRGEEITLLGESSDLDETRLLLGKPTPCVGREVELAQLESLLDGVVDEGAPRSAVVMGPPGIGKSRLRHELLRRVQARYPQSQVLVGYGDPLNAGSPYVIVGDALRRQAGIRLGDEPERARALLVEQLGRHVDPGQRRRVCEFLGELCGVPFPAEESAPLRAARGDERVKSEQIALAFLDWLAGECAAHPVVLVLEDMQWGDALSVKLLEGALRDLKQGPLLVLALGRPEVEESFPKLLAGQRAFSLSLRPLSTKASEALIKGVLGEIDEAALARVVKLAGGNALFLEELIRAAVAGEAGDVPETVVAILQARLSRLPPEARQALRAGCVFGETFWRGAVLAVCQRWSATTGDVEAPLAQLVEAELIEKRRSSRFPGEVEYDVRHQLVCEAAKGLSTEEDVRSGHQAAGRWLEQLGEPDGIVLARHAEEGGEPARALAFYGLGAEQSITQLDFAEALARAGKGIACGAAGEALGKLRSVQLSALYSTARFVEAAEVGLAALELLPPGGRWWCVTVEKLLQVLPNVGELERCEKLADELLAVEPAPDARDAYLRALHVQLLGYAISANHARGEACLAFIDKLGADVSQDIVIRGYSRLWRAIFAFIAGTDLPLALALAEEAERDLAESQVMYRLALAHLIKAFIWWALGDLAASETAARQGGAVAAEIRDDYHGALAAWYLGLALSQHDDPAKLAEVERCAQAVASAGVSPGQDTYLPRILTGLAAVTKEDWPRAEADGGTARTGLLGILPYALLGSAALLRALVAQGRPVEAATVAREDLARVRQIGGPMCTEVLFRVAAAEALHASGDRDAGKRALGEALEQIELRAGKIADPSLKKSYLERRPENVRAFALKARWLGEGAE